jgi:uncharacterized membrane protein
VTAPHEEPQDHHQAGASWGRTRVEAEFEAEAKATERMITFSDAVVAIAITLLALELAVPVTTDGMTDGQVLHLLGADWSQYLAFLISFAVIGSHWASHRRIFRYVSRWNAPVGRLNMVWLLMMVLTPFAAKLLAGSGGFAIRFGIYAVIQVIATTCLMLMSLEIARANLLLPGAPEQARHPDITQFLVFIVMFLVAIPVAFATEGAYALWAAVPLVHRVVKRVTATGRHGT